jgi:hypothetical protein
MMLASLHKLHMSPAPIASAEKFRLALLAVRDKHLP